jgi:acyl carrier protein
MTREQVYEKLNEIFQDVFDDGDITVNDETTAADIDGWDSLMHITLVGTVEDEFDIKFSVKDIAAMKNVGQMVDRILEEV